MEKNDNPVEKKPEEMTAPELEQFILKSHETKPVEPKTEEKKEEPKDEAKEPKEKKEPPKELIAGKFKSVEELSKAYLEAEKKISQQGEESSKAKKQAELLRQQLSQFYNLDGEGNVVGVKQAAPQTQDQLAGIREYFPGYTDEQITAIMGLNGLMINSALTKFKEEVDKSLEPIYEIKFEREVEKQKKMMRDKYKEEGISFSELEDEVNLKLQSLPASLRAKEGCVETIFLNLRGEKVPKFIEKAVEGALKDKKERTEKSEEAFVESSGKTHVPTPPINIAKMSADELEKHINTLKRK